MGREQTTYDWKYTGVEPWTPGCKNRGYSPSDAALRLAIAHVWLSDGTYDKDCAKTGVAGFERFRDYVLGDRDGIPKGPRWAAPFIGVPSYTIKALARHWAEACPSEVLAFGNEEDLAELVSKAKLLRPELSPRPRARHAGLPGTFVGGTVYDYEADEVIEGALVTVRLGDGTPGTEGAREAELTVDTDEFGNFLVDGPKQGTYFVSIEKEGYVAQELGPIRVEEDLNLRDFAMFPDSRGLIW
jgi:hypothetical protein